MATTYAKRIIGFDEHNLLISINHAKGRMAQRALATSFSDLFIDIPAMDKQAQDYLEKFIKERTEMQCIVTNAIRIFPILFLNCIPGQMKFRTERTKVVQQTELFGGYNDNELTTPALTIVGEEQNIIREPIDLSDIVKYENEG